MNRRFLSVMLAGILMLSQCQIVPAAEFGEEGSGVTVTTEAAAPEEDPADLTEEAASPEDTAAAQETEVLEPATEEAVPEAPAEETEEPEAPAEEAEEPEAPAEEAKEPEAPAEEAEEPEAPAEEAEEPEAPVEGTGGPMSETSTSLAEEDLCIEVEGFDQNMECGVEYYVNTRVMINDGSGNYTQLEGYDINYIWEPSDSSQLDIQDNGGGSFTITRLDFNYVGLSLRAEISENDSICEVTENCDLYCKEYQIDLNMEESSGRLFKNGTWSCPLVLDGLENAAYDLILSVNYHDGPEGASAEEACRVDVDESMLYIDGYQLDQLGISYIDVRVNVAFGGHETDLGCEWSSEVEDPRIDRDLLGGDVTILPGWEFAFGSSFNIYVEDGNHPSGENFAASVTNVSVDETEGEDVVDCYEEDGQWKFKGRNMGSVCVTVGYNDWDDCPAEYTFNLHVTGENYYVNMWTDDGSHNVLPGKSKTVFAEFDGEIYDGPDSGSHRLTDEERAGLSIEWDLEFYSEEERQELEDLISLSVDPAHPEEAAVGFENVPTDYHDLFFLVVARLMKDGEVVADNNCHLNMRSDYYEVWPIDLAQMHVGDSVDFCPEIRRYSVDDPDNWEVITADYGSVEIDNIWDNRLNISDPSDGGWTIERVSEQEAGFSCRVSVVDDQGTTIYEENIEYRLPQLDYCIELKEWESTGDLFSSGTWSAPFEISEELRDAHPDLAITAIKCAYDFSIPEDQLQALAFSLNPEDMTISIDGDVLAQYNVTYVFVRVGAMVNGIEIEACDEHEMHVREAKVDRHFNCGDDNLLPGRDYHVDKYQNCHVENGTYPYGQDFTLEITDVSVENENILELEEAAEDYWHFRAGEMGSTKVTLTYNDWDGTEQTQEFTVTVSGSVYSIDLWNPNGSNQTLTGGSVDFMAHARCEQYDPSWDEPYHTCSDEELAGITYAWSIDFYDEEVRNELEDKILLIVDEADPSKATVSFENVPAGYDFVDVEVRVCISENGEVLASRCDNASMKKEYLQLWPRDLGINDLDVGQEITFTPELRSYAQGDYTLVPADKCVFSAEIYDDQAYTITEGTDAEENRTFTVKRLTAYGSSFRIQAFILNEDNEMEPVDDIEFWLDNKDYSFWYDIPGNDQIFSDGSRTFGFNLDNLANSEFELVPIVGTGAWNEEAGSFETTVEEGDGWSYNDSDNTITFDGAALSAQGINHIETRISAGIGGVEVYNEMRGFDVNQSEYQFGGALDDLVLFPVEENYIGRQGSAFIRNSDYPDGADVPYVISAIEIRPESDDPQAVSPVALEQDGEYGWKVKPLTMGNAIVTATITLDPDGANISFERVSTIIVTSKRFTMNLVADNGTDRFRAPGSLTISPRCYLEIYDPETGRRDNDDPLNYDITYEVICASVSDFVISSDACQGNPDLAYTPGTVWNWAKTDDGRSIVLTATEEAGPGMDFDISAVLKDKETGEVVCEGYTHICTGAVVQIVELFDPVTGESIDWDEDVYPGEKVTVTPQVMVYGATAEPQAIETFDTSNVTYNIGFYPGFGDDDPPHIKVWDKNGNPVPSGGTVTADLFPLTIQRQVPWDFSFNMEARWHENVPDFDLSIYREFACDSVDDCYIGFSAENAKGDENYANYYYYQPIHVSPITDSVDALKQIYPDIETTYEIGIFDHENEIMQPIIQYGPADETGKRGAAEGEFDMSPYFNPDTGVLSFTENQLAELEAFQENLAYQVDEYGSKPYLDLRAKVTLDGVVLGEKLFCVSIFTPYCRLDGFNIDMAVGEEQLIPKDAAVSLDDAGHDYDNYEITVTDVIFEDNNAVTVTETEEGWLIKAVSPTFDYASTNGYMPFDVAFESKDGSVMNNGRPCHMAVNIVKYEFTVTPGEKIYLDPGEELALADILANSTLSSVLYSAADPEGKAIQTDSIIIDGPANAADQDAVTFTADKLTVSEEALAGGEEVRSIPILITAHTSEGYACSGTYDILIHKHVCKEWTTTKAATVFETGTKTGVCKYCGEPMTAIIKKLTPTIKLSKNSIEIAKTKSVHITVSCQKGDSIDSVATSNSAIATANRGDYHVTITAKKKAGKATITVNLKSGKSAKCTVTVPKVKCTSITAESNYTVTTKSTIKLNVTLKPAMCDSTITYTSSNKKIATVTKKGVVKGVKRGTCYVSIKTDDGKIKKVKIVVKQGTNSIRTDNTKYTVKKGKTVTIKTTLNPTSSKDNITYKSSNKSIATVSKKGKVTGKKKGTVTITIKSGTITKKVTVNVK